MTNIAWTDVTLNPIVGCGARQPPKGKPAKLGGKVWRMFPGDHHA